MAFVEKMKSFFDKSVDASKSAFEKAGDAVQEFGDKSVTKIEIKKLETKLEKQYEKFGKFVYEFSLSENDFAGLKDSDEYKTQLDDIKSILDEIETKKNEINLEKKEKNS